ncbi:MAG: hypothetical protein HRT82_16590 [Henriciella sp.]|nr:hypothetical protein [Henriciella sp.]
MKPILVTLIAIALSACDQAEPSYEEMTPEQRLEKITALMAESGWTVVDIGRVAKECADEGAEGMENCAADKGDPIARWIVSER